MAPVGQQSWTRKELCRVLALEERQLRTWEKQGLISPAEEYGFAHMRTLRTLNALRAQKIPVNKIKESVDSLKVRLGDVQNPLDRVKMFADGKRIGVQYGGMRLDPVSGQLLFDFEAKPEAPRLLAPRHEPQRNREQSDFWFQKGLELEQSSGKVDEAIEAYKKAIELNPNAAGAFVNLGTIFFHRREWAQSEKFYTGAIGADPNYALAHYNLGPMDVINELARREGLGGLEEKALRKALQREAGED